MATSNSQHGNSNSNSPYELIYWPEIPGRGEYIRLCFEATSTPYTDVGNASPTGIKILQAATSPSSRGTPENPPPFAPPILKHGSLQISQTPNILLYLGPRLGLVPDPATDPNATYHVNSLALTALDGLSNEAHDTHHPVAVGDYYEDQKVEAKRKAADYIANRLPKFLAFFERVLGGEASRGGEWLYGGALTYADLVLFQCLDGNAFAFPRAVAKLRKSGKFERVWALHERVRERKEIKAYLDSDRRMKYGMGLFRRYPELDLQE